MPKMIRIIALLLTAVVSVGLCSTGEKLSELTIVQGAGFDYGEDGVVLTVQYLDLARGNGKIDGIAGNITATVSAAGRDAKEALSAVQSQLACPLYLSQCKLIVLGGNCGREELDALCRMMMQESKLRLNTAVVLTDSARQVMEHAQQNAIVPAEAAARLWRREGKTVTVNQLLGMYWRGDYAALTDRKA